MAKMVEVEYKRAEIVNSQCNEAVAKWLTEERMHTIDDNYNPKWYA